jgi:glutathionylspermidine synthase
MVCIVLTKCFVVDQVIFVEDIGWVEGPEKSGSFVDLDNEPIHALFKLYPWEWIVNDPFGKNMLSLLSSNIDSSSNDSNSTTEVAKRSESSGQVCVMEPPWKMLLSNKAILAVLWEMYVT